jgi:NAD(P)-dependent dehydrogenase (short-subunit alcohol dehydrogenase family)
VRNSQRNPIHKRELRLKHPLGAGRGIGQQIALHFALAGAGTIILLDLAVANLTETIKLCEEHGSQPLPFACNVSRQEQVDSVFDDIFSKVGDIDILINVAGVCNAKPILLETYATIWKDIEVNLGGVRSYPCLHSS